MRTGTPRIVAVDRTLDFLERIVADRGTHNVSQLAEAEQLALATAHRQVKTLVARGYLMRIAKGRYVAGHRLIHLGSAVDPIHTLSHAARPALGKLAIAAKGTAHLGVLENDMVTYLVKVGPTQDRLFTEEGKQLEAYCSGIGKLLLSYLPAEARENYLTGGPFTALTARTITDPALLRAELAITRQRGFAIDDEEIAIGIQCVAIPVIWPDGIARAAISLSRNRDASSPADVARMVSALQTTAATLVARLFS